MRISNHYLFRPEDDGAKSESERAIRARSESERAIMSLFKTLRNGERVSTKKYCTSLYILNLVKLCTYITLYCTQNKF